MKNIFSVEGPLVSFAVKVFDCMCLSVLWAVFSLPMVTAVASSSALYSSVYKNIRKDRGKLWQCFWDAFRDNFKRSLVLGIIILIIMALLTVDILVFRNMKIQGDPLGNVYWVMLVIYCIILTWLVYLAAYNAKFNGSVKEVLKLSFVLMSIHPIKALGIFLPIICAAVIALSFPGLIIILPAGLFWVCSFMLENVFLLHMRQEDIDKVKSEDQAGN